MRQVLAVLVLAALLLGATVEASTSSFGVRISMVEAVYDPYPVSPPSSFTAAVLELEAKEDIYVRSNMCPHFENLICSGSNIFPCCKNPVKDCDNITLKSKNSSCACASRKDRVCVDDQTPFTNVNDGGRFLLATPWERQITFEIPLRSACWPMIISTGSLFGDYDIYLVQMTESPEADLLGPVLGAFTFGQDSLMLCPGNLSGGAFNGPNSMSMWMNNTPPGDNIPRIMGFIGGYGHFNLTVKEVTHRQGLVRYADDLNYKLALPMIDCPFKPNSTINVVPSGPPVVPTMLPAVDEPALDLLLASASIKNLYEDILNNNALKRNTRTMSMLISVAQDTLNSVTTSTPFFGCQLNASMLVTASGMPFEDLVILQQTDPDLATCDFERLEGLQKALNFSEENCSSTSDDIYCKLLANTTNLALSGITRVMLAPGVQSTVTWANCQKFVQKFLWSSANYSAPKNTDCWATPGSEEYAEDPCCNVKLLWEDCCNPRYAPPITWTPNDTLISDECGDSECAYNLASALSTYQSTQYQCRKEGIDAAMTVYDPFSNGLNVRGLGPCASAVAGNNDTEFLECADTYLDTAYKAEFYSLWGKTNDSIAGWLEAANKTYTMSVCHQPGLPPFNPSEPPARNLLLDGNETACTEVKSCNWGDPGQTNDSCERSFRGQFMCASCTDGYCIDQTTPQVCYVPWLGEVQCRELNGTVSDPPIMCWLNGTTEQADCLPAQYCEPDSLICPSLCYFPSLNQSDCAAAGPGRAWNTNTSLCVLESSTQVLREDCDLFGGAFWHGAQWQAGVRNTSSTCLGYCDDFPSAITEAECNSYPRPTGKCSNFGFYDEASCKSAEGCNDEVLYNNNKSACITDFLIYTSTATGCGGVGTSVPGAGCIYDDDSVPPLTAAGICSDPEFPGVLRGPAGRNETKCRELGRCQEANFAPNVTTPKSRIECEGTCNGTFVPAFKWSLGVWTPFIPVSHWHPLTWVARNYSKWYYTTTSFNREAFLLDFYQVLAARQARAVKAAYLCKGGGLFDLVSAMACRCGASSVTADDSKCKPIGAYFVLERTRACLASPLPIDFGLPGESVQLMPGASYSPACADLSIEEVNIELFQRRSLVESSSILLQILAPNENAVVPNSVGVIVAVLAGDGRRIALEKTVLASSPGNYTVCIAYNHSREVANFKHPGMAMWDARSRKWTLVTDGVRVISTQILCANLTISPDMIVFPVKAVKHPESQPFKDYLSPPVRRAILASIIVYIVLSLLTLLRLLLAIGATIEDRKDSKLSNLLVCIMFLAIFAATTLRWVYSLVFYLGRNIHASDGVQLLLVDLPFFLYATAFSILISRWARMYYEYLQYMRTTDNLNINTKRVSFVAVSVNVVLYVLFIAVLFTFSTKSLPNNNGESACTATSDKSSARILHIVGKAYRSIEALVSVLLAVGFLVYSCVVYMPYWHIFVPSSNFQMLLNVSIIALLCAICLLLQAATFLYAAYTSTVDGTFIIITLLVVESIPVITLLFMRSARAMLPCLPWCTMPEPTSTTKSSDVNQAESD